MEVEFINNYALALFDLAEEEANLEEYRSQIKDLVKIFKENERLIELFQEPLISKETKYKFIDKVFSQFNFNIVNFLKVIINNNRSFYMYRIIKRTLNLLDRRLNIQEGKLYSAVELTPYQIEKIRKTIEEDTGSRIEIKTFIEPSLIGGFKVLLKDDVYDTSLLSKLHNLKNNILLKRR